MSKDKTTFPTGLITIVFINNLKYVLYGKYGLIHTHLNLKSMGYLCSVFFLLTVWGFVSLRERKDHVFY